MRNKKIFWLFVVLSLFYVLVTLFTPSDQSVLVRYGVSATEATLIELTVTLPIVAIWFLAYLGWSKISEYTQVVEPTKEASGFQKITNGLLAFVLMLPINSTYNALARSIYSDNQSLTAPLVIVGNYVHIAILLYAVIMLSKGAFELKSLAKKKLGWGFTNFGMVLLAILSFLYVYITLSNPYRQFAGESGTATYYLPDWLLASTVIFPYLIIFYLGFRTVQYIHIYKHSVPGVIYGDALKYIANGIGVSLIAILAIRYLASLNSVFEDAALKLVLALIYALVVLIGIGFWLIGRGAKKLQQIEEL